MAQAPSDIFKDIRDSGVAVERSERKHSYSGVDISAILIFPDVDSRPAGQLIDSANLDAIDPFQSPSSPQGIINNDPVLQRRHGGPNSGEFLRKYRNTNHYKVFAEIQTISVTSTSAIFPVRSLGFKTARTYNRGARTFAGSMVFAVLDRDVIYEAARRYKKDRSTDKYYIDDIPPFDIVIEATNEYGDAAIQIISGIVLSHAGTTYSIDDLYTEQTFTYIANHVTPLIKLTEGDKYLLGQPHNGLIRPGKYSNPQNAINQDQLNVIKNEINGRNTYKYLGSNSAINNLVRSTRIFR